MSQLDYALDAPVGFEGMLASTINAQVRSFFSGEASAEIGYGRLLQQGTNDTQAKILSATNNRIIGVSVFTYAREPGPVSGGIIPKDPVDVLKEGEIWVICEDAFTKSSTVYARAVATGDEKAGQWRASADSTDCIVVYGAHFLNSGAAGALARLYFNLEAHLAGAAAAAA